MIVVGDGRDVGARPDVGALLEAHADLLAFLTEQDADPDRGVWRSQVQRLTARYARSVAAVRDAGMSVHLAGGDTSRDGMRMFVSAGGR
ncbi:hypothetical protein [Rhodococcus koreensis]